MTECNHLRAATLDHAGAMTCTLSPGQNRNISPENILWIIKRTFLLFPLPEFQDRLDHQAQPPRIPITTLRQIMDHLPIANQVKRRKALTLLLPNQGKNQTQAINQNYQCRPKKYRTSSLWLKPLLPNCTPSSKNKSHTSPIHPIVSRNFYRE